MLTFRTKKWFFSSVLAFLMAVMIPLAAQASDYGAQDLTLGSTGAFVSQLQKDLTGLGFYSNTIDASFGPKTSNAVMNFQNSKGLKADGIVGPITKAALNAALAGVMPTTQGSTTPPASSSPPPAATPPAATPTTTYTSNNSYYNSHAKPIVDSLRASYNGSLSQAIVGRAIWYMEYGYMVYGHSKYPSTGYIDCSNFTSLVYKDFGYSITSAARNYDQVGVKVPGISIKNGTMIGADLLKPGDLLTFERTNYISHVAMFIGNVNGKPCFIGCTTGYPTTIGIVSGFNNWYGTQFHDVRRVLPDSAYSPGGTINDRGPVIPAKYQMKPDQAIVMPKNLATGF